VYFHGISDNDVIALASHTSFSAGHDFYLAAMDDLVGRERQATAQGLSQKLVQICFTAVYYPPKEVDNVCRKWLYYKNLKA